MAPVVGEVMDVYDLVAPSSTTSQRTMSGVSLGVGAIFAGVLPNMGAIKRATAILGDGGHTVARGLPDAAVSGPKSLREMAREVSHSGSGFARRRTVAVGADSNGRLWAGSSNGFDAGQRAALERLGIQRVPGSAGLHAEEELLRALRTEGGPSSFTSIGTFSRMPCSDAGHMCAQQLFDWGIPAVGGGGWF